MSKSQKDITANEPEIVSGGIGHSGTTTPKGKQAASPAELALALESMQQQNAMLKAQLDSANTGSSDNGIDKLAHLLSNLVDQKAKPTAHPNTENLGRSFDYNTKTTVDGRSMFETQQTLQLFRDEPKVPVSVSGTFKDSVGASLSVSVNGVRISVPCDGKMYYINKTHAEHLQEKMQKISMQRAKTAPQITVIDNE